MEKQHEFNPCSICGYRIGQYGCNANKVYKLTCFKTRWQQEQSILTAQISPELREQRRILYEKYEKAKKIRKLVLDRQNFRRTLDLDNDGLIRASNSGLIKWR